MTFKRKISLMALITILSTSMLGGCTSNENSGKTIDSAELLKNKDARLAITMAVDKEKITDIILNNVSNPINYYTPEGLAINNEGKDYIDKLKNMGSGYDLKLARIHWNKVKTVNLVKTVGMIAKSIIN